MRELSDEEKAGLQTKIEESRERKTHRIAWQSWKSTIVGILVTVASAILGGLAGCYGVFLYDSMTEADYSEWGLGLLLIFAPMGAIIGAIIGFLLFLLALRFWIRR